MEAADGLRLPIAEPYQLDDCGWVANRWSELLPLPAELKQRLMELDSPVMRLELVSDLLARTRHHSVVCYLFYSCLRRTGGRCRSIWLGPGRLESRVAPRLHSPFMPDHPTPPDDNQLIAERRDKLKNLRAAQADGKGVAFPNDFKPADRAAALLAAYDDTEADALEAQAIAVSVAGRMMLKRVMGKASFATLQDSTGRIQLYITRDAVGDEAYAAFKHWDLGDIVGASGTAFKTKTGELSVKVTQLRLLTKSLRPLPDKFHGMADQEQKYRQRYVDLITDEQARARFVARSRAVSALREFMVSHGFLEVETPMLHPIPGGANAKPFKTHHNALDQEMFLRIAPELYLKRLIVGGFERVFEINRSYRNEGISVRHNPEFTMMEFYAAYWNYRDLMDFTETHDAHHRRKGRGHAAAELPGQGGRPEPALRAADHPRGDRASTPTPARRSTTAPGWSTRCASSASPKKKTSSRSAAWPACR